jgi:hypothetical protein
MAVCPMSRRLSAVLIPAVLLGAFLAAPRAGAAQSAKQPYQLSVFARSASGYSQPDSIVQWGASVIVG